MTGTAGLNDTTIAASSTAHASTAHGHGDPTPPRQAAPPVARAGASRSITIAVHTGKFECRPGFMLDQNALQNHRRARLPRLLVSTPAPYFPSYRLALVKPGWSVAERCRLGVTPPAAVMRVTLDWVRSANGYCAEPETNRSAPRPARARGRRARARS